MSDENTSPETTGKPDNEFLAIFRELEPLTRRLIAAGNRPPVNGYHVNAKHLGIAIVRFYEAGDSLTDLINC